MLRANLTLAIVVLLVGCASHPPIDTIPSPTEKVSPNNFQLRLTDIIGDSARAAEAQIQGGSILVGGEGATAEQVTGKATGCVLTAIGKPQHRLKATLVTLGGCRVHIKYGEGTDPPVEVPGDGESD